MKFKYLAIALAGAAITASAHKTHLETLYPNEFEPGQVKLLDGPFRHAMEVNVNHLKQYDMDRLLAPYYIEAGLQPKGEPFPNWAGLDGHIGGHYLSALAISYAATGDPELLSRMQYFLDEMETVQKANGDGYIGGVPKSKECWADLRKGDITAISSRWVPWYNEHKVAAGLRDAYIYGGSEQAKRMFFDLCDWAIDVTKDLNDEQMEQMLNTEYGGMNEVLADAYEISGDEKYLAAAKRFTHNWLFDSMLAGVDNLDNNHANTQVPKVVGFQRVSEVDGANGDYWQASEFFWDRVVNHRSIAIGGNSRREYFPSASDCISYTEDREGPESCNTNNMMKLTEGLFRMHRDSKYSDFYERAMFNHILSTQHPEHGGYVYFTSARPAHYRVYSQPNSGMWCCVGTGMENHGKYGQFVYTHSGKDTLEVNLFVPSELDWNGLKVRQEADIFADGMSTLTFSGKAKNLTLSLRRPYWAQDYTVTVNGKAVDAKPGKDGYVNITRKWKKGDVVKIEMPMAFRLEELPNVPNFVAIMRGPIVMAARVGTEDLDGLVAGDGRWGHIASGRLIPLNETPMLIGDRQEIVKKLNEMPLIGTSKYDASALFDGQKIELEPFAGVHDCRYMMYWLTMTPAQWEERQAALAAAEAERLRIDGLSIDAINYGEQQPEVDHHTKSERSVTGVWQGQSYRHAEGGWWSSELETKGHENVSLMARYWGDENGARKFDIYVDDQLLTECDNAHLIGRGEFVDVAYDVPAEMVKGKDIITVKFVAKDGNIAGGCYMLRLINNE